MNNQEILEAANSLDVEGLSDICEELIDEGYEGILSEIFSI